MSGVAIVAAMLVGNGPLTAKVQPGAIKTGGLPENISPPSLLVTSIGGVDDHGIRGAARLVIERVQVTIRAATYRQQKDIETLVRLACDGRSGTIAGYAVLDVQRAGIGPDFRDDAEEWLGSADFKVSFRP